MPHPVMVVDDDVVLVDGNTAALELVANGALAGSKLRCGEALRCIHSVEDPQGCGHSASCRACVIRNSVRRAFEGGAVSRRAHRLDLMQSTGDITPLHILVTTAPIEMDGKRLALLVLEDISEIIVLRGIVPMCASCRKVRNDDEFWVNVEAYFRSKLNIDFSHGLCPDCMQRLYPGELE